VCDVVYFDTKNQPRTKLICWISIPRQFKCKGQRYEFLLPRRVVGRYITTVFIESENFLTEMNDINHPVCNVDIGGILLGGQLIEIDGLLTSIDNL